MTYEKKWKLQCVVSQIKKWMSPLPENDYNFPYIVKNERNCKGVKDI